MLLCCFCWNKGLASQKYDTFASNLARGRNNAKFPTIREELLMYF